MTAAHFGRWPAWAASALLAACSSLPPAPAPIVGRLSVHVAATGSVPARGFHAAFELAGDAERGRLDLSTPLGPTIAVLQWAPGDVRLTATDGERRFDTLEAMSMAVLGEALPLQALPDWLRGRPWAATPHASEGEGFSQLGWRLDLSSRGEGLVVAQRETPPPSVTLRVRLSEPAS